jgi:hypothetical protein
MRPATLPLLLAALILFAGCAKKTEPLQPLQEETSVGTDMVSDRFYQPTDHALLVIGGDAASSADPLTTVWRRDGASTPFTIELLPGRFRVVGLIPGRYSLVSAAQGDVRADLAGGTVQVSALQLEPGDVVDAGTLSLRGSGGAASIVVRDDANGARAAVQATHPLQAGSLRSDVLRIGQ